MRTAERQGARRGFNRSGPGGPAAAGCRHDLPSGRGLNGTQNFYERPYEVLRCGTLPTFYLIDHYVRCGKLGRFVFAGTPESYASTVSRFDWEIPTDETVPLCVDDVFNDRLVVRAAKIHGEVLTINACPTASVCHSRSFAITTSTDREWATSTSCPIFSFG